MAVLQFCSTTLVLAALVLARQPDATVDGVPIIGWKEAGEYYDRDAVVYGRIVETRNIGRIAFLNFHYDYRRYFTAIIRQQHFAAFPAPPEEMYRDKLVAIRGKVIRYRDKPQIVVTAPEQIVILPADTDDLVATVKKNPPRLPGSAHQALDSRRPSTIRLATVSLASLTQPTRRFCAARRDPQAAAIEELEQAAEVIRDLDAELVALQWAAGLECLQRFNATMISDAGYTHVVGSPDAGGTVGSALLSRREILSTQSLNHVRTRGGEELAFRQAPLRVELRLSADHALTILVVGFDRQDLNPAQRADEARKLRKLIDDLFHSRPEARLLVAGGFGDSLDGPALQALLKSPVLPLSVPGYTATAGPGEPPPPIARAHNLILTAPGLESRYVAGSTRIRQGRHIESAVSLALYTSAQNPTQRQPPPTAATPPPSGDF